MAQLQQTAITGTLTTTSNLTVTGSITNTGNIRTGGDLILSGGNILSSTNTVAVKDSLSVDGDITVNGEYIYSDGAQFILKPSSGHTQITGTVGITQTLSASGNITTAGDLAVNGGDITSTAPTLNINAGGTLNVQDNLTVQGTVSSSNNITTAGDLAVNGGDITSTASTFNLLQNSNRITIGSGSNTSIRLGGLNTIITSSTTVIPRNNFLVLEIGNLPGEGSLFEPAIYFTSGGFGGIQSAIQQDNTSFDLVTNKDLRLYAYSGTFDGITYALTQDNSTKAISIGSIPQPSLASVYITGSSSIRLDANAISLNTNGNTVNVTGSIIASNTVRGMSSLFAGNSAGTNIEISPLFMKPVVAQTSYSFFPSNVTDLVIGGSTVNLGFASTVTSSIKFSNGQGIDFSNTSQATGMTSELFDDYEEGTWTPVLSGSTTAGSYTYTGTAGTYTKIGSVVYFTCFLQVSATSVSGSGTLNITGLPFTISATGTGRTCYGAVGQYSGFSTSVNMITWHTVPNSARVNFFRNTTESTSLSTLLTHADVAATPLFRFSGFYYTF